MKIYDKPKRESWSEILKRPQIDSSELIPRVAAILNSVRNQGDSAIKEFSRQFDKVEIQELKVTPEDIRCAIDKIEPELAKAIKIAYENIAKFHSAQKYSGIDVEISAGIRCLQRSVPIQRVGLYIPGGSAPLFSTVLMLAVPASIAGCKEVILCTPPNSSGEIHPAILYTANLCGITQIFKVGGAQAIAAMAYGTQTIPKVDKIFGPGNQYVTVAKQQVSLYDVAIDMPAGPSEVLVLADKSGNPTFIAADLLSQAEHGGDSQAILITSSQRLAQEVECEVEQQLRELSRSSIASKAIENSRLIVVNNCDEMIELANFYAAEHLILSLDNAWDVANRITAAGSIFIGNYTPESVGDYASGTNHTLPTNGWAGAYSGVNLDSFNRKITYQELTKDGLKSLASVVEMMALAEGLDAHAKAVSIRVK